MKILQTSRRSGFCPAALAHCAIIGTRITTYPATITPLSRCSPSTSDSNMSCSPSASTSTPTICTIVVMR
jgi:hypothetical protein